MILEPSLEIGTHEPPFLAQLEAREMTVLYVAGECARADVEMAARLCHRQELVLEAARHADSMEMSVET